MHKFKTILAIESSCDETAAAVVKNGRTVYSNVIASQIPIHIRFGGVVPEVAARAHVEQILPVIEQAIYQAYSEGESVIRHPSSIIRDRIDEIAVTTHPGLVGSLLVGVNAAKALAYACDKPLISVNHLDGHIFSPYLDSETEIIYPTVTLAVSGGHTALYLIEKTGTTLISQTRDDAAGEAFDKAAALLNLPYPGGPSISQAASLGDLNRYTLPRGLSNKAELDFSFSGLKTALADLISKLKKNGIDIEKEKNHLAAAFQISVIDSLVGKTIHAGQKYQAKRIALCGGVAANTLLRQTLSEQCKQKNIEFIMPKLEFCTDNAAMIGAAAYFKQTLAQQSFSWYDIDVKRL